MVTLYQQVKQSTNMVYTPKADDFTKNNDDSLEDIPDLSFEGKEGEIWSFSFPIKYTASAAGDIKFYINAPSGSTGHWTTDFDFFLHVQEVIRNGTNITLGGDGTDKFRTFVGVIDFGADGNCTLQMAQVTADVSDAIVYGTNQSAVQAVKLS